MMIKAKLNNKSATISLIKRKSNTHSTLFLFPYYLRSALRNVAFQWHEIKLLFFCSHIYTTLDRIEPRIHIKMNCLLPENPLFVALLIILWLAEKAQ